MIRILGIDPGSRTLGFGVIDHINGKNHYIASGLIKIDSNLSLALRLKQIFEDISFIVQSYKPQVTAVEKVFVNINPSATLMLGQARGAIICALSVNNLPVYEYTALQVKKTAVGYGHADKHQVQVMMMQILGLINLPKPDAADALAVALCHASYLSAYSTYGFTGKLKKGRFR